MLRAVTTVRMNSSDSDVFFTLLHYVTSIKDTGNKQRMIDVSKIAEDFGQEKCTVLMFFSALSGFDSTSAFRGIG